METFKARTGSMPSAANVPAQRGYIVLHPSYNCPCFRGIVKSYLLKNLSKIGKGVFKALSYNEYKAREAYLTSLALCAQPLAWQVSSQCIGRGDKAHINRRLAFSIAWEDNGRANRRAVGIETQLQLLRGMSALCVPHLGAPHGV